MGKKVVIIVVASDRQAVASEWWTTGDSQLAEDVCNMEATGLQMFTAAVESLHARLRKSKIVRSCFYAFVSKTMILSRVCLPG